MGRVAFILCVLTGCAFAQFPGITYNQWNDFEQCTNASAPTATCLNNSDHVATGSWSVTNPHSIITVQSAAQGTETGTSGTHGYQYSGNPSTQNDYIQYCFDATCTFATTHSTMSMGFFYKTGTCTGFGTECGHTVVFSNNANGDLTRISDEKDAVNNNRELRISPCNGGTVSCEVAVADATTYWITMKYVQNGTTSMSVYTAAYVLVGSATYAANINFPVDHILFGNDLGALNATFTINVDDIIMDWTSAVYPLLPNVNPVYVSQSGGPVSCGGDGTQNTEAIATFNAGALTAGNSYKLCGAITSAVAPSTTGTAGNIITLQWESNASVQACNTTGAVQLGSLAYWLLDLGNDSTAIECLNNGTGLGTTVNAVGVNTTGNNNEIRNGTIGPLYQYTCCAGDGLSSVSIQLGANSNVLLHGLSLNNANAGMVWSLAGTTSGNAMYNNTCASTVGRCIDYANGTGTGTDTGVRIHDNDFAFGDGWYSGAGNFTHIEVIRTFNFGGSGTDTITDEQIYNNYFHGSSQGDATSYIFIPDGGACPSTNSALDAKIFNNLFVLSSSSSSAPGDGFIFTQDCHHALQIYNNTLDCGANTISMIGVEYEGTNTVTMKNNIIENCKTMFYNTASGITLTEDHDDYYNVGAGGWYWQNTNYVTLATWKAATGQGTGDITTIPGLNGNYTITNTGSAAYQSGTNLTSLGIASLDSGAPLTFGSSGACGAGCLGRSASVAWDMGLYPFAATSPITSSGALQNGAKTINGAVIQ